MRRREKSHSRESAVGEGGCFSKLPINRGEITGIGIISVFDRTTHPRQFSAMLSAVLGERERESRRVTSLITSVTSTTRTSERLARYARLVAARTVNGSQLIRVNDIYFAAFSTYRAY